MVHRGRAVLVAVMVVGFTLVSTTPAMVQERADVTVQSVLEEHALIPLGVDNTYSNWDVWVPKTCTGSQTGFRFGLQAPIGCVGLLYDGEDNPFASPPGGATGVAGSKTGDSMKSVIEWTNTSAPVSGDGSGPHGHFGYQYDNDDTPTTTMCPASSNDPSAAWLGDGETCTAKKTLAMLVANDSSATGSDAIRVQDGTAQVIVWNYSDETIAIGLAAIPWPDAVGGSPTDSPLLERLRPHDPIFSSGFDGVPLEYASVEPGRFTSYSFDLPDTTTVVLAKYEVTSIIGRERGADYDAYVAFENRDGLYPLEPGPTTEPTSEPPTETATPSITVTPPPTPTDSPPIWIVYLPSVLFDAVAVLP